ncbi:MAG: HypC/HybG/HupF family hydrogenase formation chaperone [Fidelibacterota bacterium]
MCLAVPMKVKKISGNNAIAEVNQVEYDVNVTMMENLKVGDYVIVHAGFAIEIMDEKEAQETLALWHNMQAYNRKNS